MNRLAGVVLLGMFGTTTAPAHADRVVLQNGSVIEAATVTDDGEVVTVDLGFESLEIPKASVVEIFETKREQLYRVAVAGEEADLDDNVEAVDEAVVLVRTPVALGSGFMVHPEGYLVTNDHVIEGTTELTVIVYRKATDGLRKDEYKNIRIVASSEMLDLALLKIEQDEPEEFVTVPLGESNDVVQGQKVFAVGNPMGLERSLSEGIVALKSRLLSGQTYVQTTAALSPGNSGGPLFNMRGEVIGVNSLKVMAAGAEGLSFSIPVNRVRQFIDDQEAFAFDTLNANSGHRYYAPPSQEPSQEQD